MTQEPGRRSETGRRRSAAKTKTRGAGRARPRPRSGQNPKEENEAGDEKVNTTGRAQHGRAAKRSTGNKKCAARATERDTSGERAQRARQLAAGQGNTKKNHSAENITRDITVNDPGDTKGEGRSPESS